MMGDPEALGACGVRLSRGCRGGKAAIRAALLGDGRALDRGLVSPFLDLPPGQLWA